MMIRFLEPADAEVYRELRLKSLLENPEAFLTTYDIQKEKPIEETRRNLERSADKFTLGGFADRHKLVGMVTFIRESNPKIRHKGNIYAMYVAPEARGRRFGHALLASLLEQAGQCEGLEQINLAVVSSNAAAKRLYESAGFTVYGTERNAAKYDGRYWDDDLMVFNLQRRTNGTGG
ncbi:GNAT family N-acetyltransferase [Paenibacillus piri]|uniref:GNAT family N-acetyltransferase n=1 Tax=Paenibacillus piri TaxID=2547395 RepID=A0A4R5KFY7_9BACL|nr:GNAT family N-acetyltransferase [Paenibacillus piri]TDF93217.1 GNAT family N-acetyltransferase [Paenibacillus piri]